MLPKPFPVNQPKRLTFNKVELLTKLDYWDNVKSVKTVKQKFKNLAVNTIVIIAHVNLIIMVVKLMHVVI